MEGYEGDRCELMVTDECDPDPCQNGGTCTVRQYLLTFTMDSHCIIILLQDMFLNYMCQCIAGYEGRNCSEETNECEPNPCQNGGTCQVSLSPI